MSESDAAAATATDATGTYVFGELRINLNTYELFDGATSVAVEPQVFGLLSYLIRHRDRLVTKDELLDELWGHRYVSESALSTQIKSLRKAVGDDGQRQAIIQTVRGRGYRFVADIREADDSPAPRPLPATAPRHNLPRERTPLLGRQSDVDHCLGLFEANRLVTILGIGGTGKTRLATRVGREAAPAFPDGTWFIDLIPITSVESLETAVADVLGMALNPGPIRPQLIDALRARDLLLIFDNCEHLREATAGLINDLLEYTERPHYLATSRDPLDLIDEHRFFLGPLATANPTGTSPAVELFMTTAARHGVAVTAERERDIEQVCAQLDGLPLAIELAAAQLRHLTLDELAGRLNQRFDVLAGRERTPSGRQSNLLGVLEDTWDLLGDEDRAVLRQLSAFRSRFTMTCVEEVLADSPHQQISSSIARLVDLALIQRTSSTGTWWRVLETVRAFAVQDQSEAERETNVARHARWCLAKLGRFPDDQLDNLTQADWCVGHYADLEAAEQYFAGADELESAYAICSGTGLMVQLDDGARAMEKLQRAERYLENEPSLYWQGRLHAIAGLCAQANRLPELLTKHTVALLDKAKSVDNPELMALARLMQSLTTGFADPDEALAQLDEVVRLGEETNNLSLQRSGQCYRAWQSVIAREYARGRAQAQTLVDDYFAAPDEIDNPAYNAIGIIVTCTVVDEPQTAAEWASRMPEFPAVMTFWGIDNLLACVEASTMDFAAAARRCLDIKARLNRAARDEFPDLLVTATLLATRKKDLDAACRWLAAIRFSRVPIQMYHTIAIYRQLYEQIGFGDYTAENAPSLDEVRPEVHALLTELHEDNE